VKTAPRPEPSGGALGRRSPWRPCWNDSWCGARWHTTLDPSAAGSAGLPSSASGYAFVPASIPRKRPGPFRYTGPVCCLRRDVTGSAASHFGSLSHGAAKLTLSHSARRLAPLARSLTATAGLLTLRSDATFLGDAWSLLRGAPALAAAGLPPASLMQHLDRTVQTRPRSGRTTERSLPRLERSSPSSRYHGTRPVLSYFVEQRNQAPCHERPADRKSRAEPAEA
jgi:hypothetical protein